jgi:23S rRNA pseudouridine1911/1915/1917 synthase
VSSEQTSRLTFEIGAGAHRQKLGEYLFDNIRDLSKMYLRELIKTGKCEVNGALENSGYRLRERDFVEVEADLSRGTAMRPEDVALDIVFEDDELLVVNKPADMLVHPSHREKSGTLLNALVFHLNKKSEPPAVAGGSATLYLSSQIETRLHPPATAGGSDKVIRPGLPHRLDKQTSGLLVIAKTAHSHRVLSDHFMRRRVEKLYLGLVDGIVEADQGTISAPIGRHPELKHWSVKQDGKMSETRFRVNKRFDKMTLLELEPVTGRTNQLRIHCETIGHPIVGDIRRGGSQFKRLCLHAYKLAFPHPVNGARKEFRSHIPADFGI